MVVARRYNIQSVSVNDTMYTWSLKTGTNIKMASPTNKDIIKLITMNHEETSSRLKENTKRLEQVEQQVRYTNGQVRTLNDFKNRIETIEKYKKELRLVTKTPESQQIDWQKIILVLLGLLGSALAIISATKGAN